MLVLELEDALGELVLRLGWTPGVLWRISRRLLDVFFLRSWLRGVEAAVLAALERASDDGEVPPWHVFCYGVLVGFMGPLAGAGGGVFFTPLAVGLLGVDVNLARTGGLLVATSSVAGSFQAGGGGCES